MRFERLMWTVMAILLMGGGAVWNGDREVNTGDFQAADGGSEVPPPTKP